MIRVMLVLWCCCIPAVVFSQGTAGRYLDFKDIRKGMPGYAGASEASYMQYYLDSIGNLKMMGSLKTRDVKKGKWKNQDCLLIIQRYQSSGGINVDSAIVSAQNLQPIAYHSTIGSMNYQEHAVFEEGRIKLQVDYRDSTVMKEYDIPKNTFLFTTEREVIRALPLKPGYSSTQYRLVNTGVRHQVMDAYVKVLKESELSVDNKKIKVFYVGVSYHKKPEHDAYPIILLVSEKSHEVLQLVSPNIGFVETRMFEYR